MDTLKELAPYLTIITAIVAAYLAYQNQLRLKCFEMYYDRRLKVLDDLTTCMSQLYVIQDELRKGETEQLKKYQTNFFHEGVILYYRLMGANFGPGSEPLVKTYWAVLLEPYISKTPPDVNDWIHRTLNSLSAISAFAHWEINEDLERLAFSPIYRWRRRRTVQRQKRELNKAESS